MQRLLYNRTSLLCGKTAALNQKRPRPRDHPGVRDQGLAVGTSPNNPPAACQKLGVEGSGPTFLGSGSLGAALRSQVKYCSTQYMMEKEARTIVAAGA